MTNSDHPPGHHQIKRTLWQRWMAWSGSFFIVSILVHAILISGATVLVVQVVQGRKEKLKFTAAPPSAAPAEHKVKPSKKTAELAPAISKRIVSTAVNASIALPSIDMNSTGPDVMASVMSGMGASGLGSGAMGGADMAMPPGGLTAFGYHGNVPGIAGYFFDLKQTPERTPTRFKVTPGNPEASVKKAHFALLQNFVLSGWDQTSLSKQYYQAKEKLVATQFFVPTITSEDGPKAFGVEKEVEPNHWIALYTGKVKAPKDGEFRFVGTADDFLGVRFDEHLVYADCFYGDRNSYKLLKSYFSEPPGLEMLSKGVWFKVRANEVYPISVIMSEVPGGVSKFELYIEDRSNPGQLFFFQTKKGPLPDRHTADGVTDSIVCPFE